MRIVLGVLLSIVCAAVYSADVSCYSGKVRVYHSQGHDFSFEDNFLAFIETRSNHLILTSADCLIEITEGEKLYATAERKEKHRS